MITPNFFILYVDNPTASVAFYQALLGHPPLEASPTFAMFKLESGVMLGLWSRHTVKPGAGTLGTEGEIAFCVSDKALVDATHTDWVNKGLPVVQTPQHLDFGYTFVALDPDGHRLRVFVPE
ncbi:VOC family protein [Pseudomonas sp. KNUC1026]|uniref:VOC family protein n=1 Tax=Pseudomonas sp. KNUC1026 TaxID=2893890 RepID=UPI001F2C890A|nr:VOC family protein [Pseudomonas sp. KNUC1026]UFH50209.1 VOC family protein [Pseudomonas sp. KNUC1026]